MNKIIRNFWMTLSRYKLASTLNILSLAIAFAVFIVIMSQLYWEWSFNKSIKDSDRVNILLFDLYGEGNFANNLSRPVGEMIGKSSSMIEDYAVYFTYFRKNTKEIGEYKNVHQGIFHISPNFIDVFSMETIDGDLKRITEANKAIVPKSIADIYFKNKSAVGETFIDENDKLWEIVGVYKDFTDNSSIQNTILINAGDFMLNDRSEWSSTYFYKLIKNASLATLEQDIIKIALENEYKEEDVKGLTKFTSLDKLYFNGGFGPNGNLTLSILMLSVAILIIFIASINYINLFVALAPIRIRSVNITKVFGTSNLVVQRNIIFESIGIALIGFMLSLPIVQLISDSDISSFTSKSLQIKDNLNLILYSGSIAILLGVFAGLLPATYITSFSPALVLKGSFGRSTSGRKLRVSLTSFQFIISIVLTITSIFIMLQNSHMKDFDYGFNRDRLINTQLNGGIINKTDELSNELLKNTDIEAISYSDNSILEFGMGWGRNHNGEQINFLSLPVSWNYPEMMGLELIEGRFFIEEDATKPGGTAIFNEATAKKYNFKVGDRFNGHTGKHKAEIVGIVKDFYYRSLKEEIKPMCLYEFGSDGWRKPSYANIRIDNNANLQETSNYIIHTIKKLSPNTNLHYINIQPIDANIENLYYKEAKMSKVINLFSVISIIISLLGLFGIIVFETQYRKREVALRKINGASIAQILLLFGAQTIKVLAISSMIAIPIAWYIVDMWLNTYVQHIPIHWWVFALAILIVLTIVIGVVISQTYKAASEDPVKNITNNN